jgi:hypothetical protein
MALNVIPLVDISESEFEAAKQVYRACTDSGFFYGATYNQATVSDEITVKTLCVWINVHAAA